MAIHSFARLRDNLNLEDILILWKNAQPVGYALTYIDKSLLKISDLFLKNGLDAAEAVAEIATVRKSLYVQITITGPANIDSLRQNGFQIAYPNWGAFMIKPLVSEVTADDARQIYGIGTDHFLISWLDVT